HDHQPVVLIQDGNAALLRVQHPSPWDLPRDRLSSDEKERLGFQGAVHQDPPVGDGALDVGPVHAQMPGHDAVQTAGLCDERDGGHPRFGSPAAWCVGSPAAPPAGSAFDSRRAPDSTRRSAPITMQESATLNTGQTWKSMKSTTLPETPGPRTIR